MGSSHSSSSPKTLPSITSSQSSSPSQSTPQAQPQQLQPFPSTPQIQTQLQQLQSEATPPNIGQLNEQQLASYEIPNAKKYKEQYNEEINDNLLGQFRYNYARFYKQRAKQNEISVDIDKRANIRILIIIGSSINYTCSKYFRGTYQKNAEDLSSALLIRHLFHNAFGIPYSQILITSTQNSDFEYDNININLISEPNTIFDEINDINPFTEKVKFKFFLKNKSEFELNQRINLSQVKDQNYKFYMEEDISNIVKPFNYYVIENALKSKTDSHLLAFFIDHEYESGFSDNLSYQFFIERLLKIECKHFYIFNDSCCSGSLIKLINICNDFLDIFPDIEDPTLESALFFFLTTLNKTSPEFIKDEIVYKIEKIDTIYKSKLSEITKKDLILKLQNLEAPIIEKIYQFVINLDPGFLSAGCVPHQFIQFSKKSTIFASSAYNQISLTLPGRKLDISAFNEPKIRVFGSILISIWIESFLDKKGQSSLENFRKCIIDLFKLYKKMFIDIIISQNEFIGKKTENTSLPDMLKINSFFSADLLSETHYLNNGNTDYWPDFSSIMLEEKFWNIDKSNVDTNEYENVSFCMFKIHSSNQLIENPHNFGPAEGTFYRNKFIKDFEYAVNLLFEKNKLDTKFSFNNSKSNDEIIDKYYAGYSQFICSIKPMINSHNWQVVDSLKVPMTLFFNEKPNEIEKYAGLFAEAFKNVIIFWKEYD